MKRDILTVSDLTKEDIERIIDISLHLKRMGVLGVKRFNYLSDKHFLLLFEKPSTRTRLSFEVAIRHLGGSYSTVNVAETQISRGEPLKDFARVVSKYVDGIIARVKKHETLEEISKYSEVPVINALSDVEHPVQALADLMTIKEKLGKLEGVKIAFIGDGRDNVLNSLLIAAATMGADVAVAAPQELWPDDGYVAKAREIASRSGSKISLTTSPVEAIEDADVVYTDVWVSMGKEEEAEWRRKILGPYQVNGELLSKGRKAPLVMHCLPAVRGEEITDEVIEGPNSIVFEQAENRLHLQKGLLYYIYRRD